MTISKIKIKPISGKNLSRKLKNYQQIQQKQIKIMYEKDVYTMQFSFFIKNRNINAVN